MTTQTNGALRELIETLLSESKSNQIFDGLTENAEEFARALMAYCPDLVIVPRERNFEMKEIISQRQYIAVLAATQPAAQEPIEMKFNVTYFNTLKSRRHVLIDGVSEVDADAIVKKFAWLLEVRKEPARSAGEIDMSTLEEWEELAEQFRKQTGHLRPGKDVGGAYNETDEMRDERYAAWDIWIAAKRAKAQTAPEVI